MTPLKLKLRNNNFSRNTKLTTNGSPSQTFPLLPNHDFSPNHPYFFVLHGQLTIWRFRSGNQKVRSFLFRALGFALVASMIVGCLFMPTGFIHKPTPYLWKAFGGLSFFYLSVLIYFLYLVIYN